jgi:O-antigen ligase
MLCKRFFVFRESNLSKNLSMNRFYHSLIVGLIAALLLLTPASVHAAQRIYPQGLGAAQTARGIYPGDDAGSCCWMGQNARFHVVAPMGADTLLITVFIPDYAVRGDSQAFRVRMNGGAWQEQCCFGAGMHELAISLGEPLQRPQPLTVELAMRTTFVPEKLNLNDDPRALSALLRAVSFENAQSGARLSGGTSALAQPAIDLAVLVLGGLLAAALAYWRPVAGVIALVVSDPFSFSYYVHGTALTLPKAVLVGAILALLCRRTFARGQTLWLLLGAQLFFIATMLVASIHAFSHGAAMRETLKGVQYAITLVVAYAAYRLDPDELRLRGAFAGTLLLVSVLALAEEFTGSIESTLIHGHTFARIAGPLEGPNQLAAFIGVMLPVVLAFALLRAPVVLERFAIGLGAAACLLTISRGGIAALAVACAVLFALRYRPSASRAIGIAAGAVFAIALGLAFTEFAGILHGGALAIFGGTGDRYNGGLGSRPDLWHGAYAMFRAHPLFGVGPGNFELLISKYAPGVHTHANSIYFQTLAEQGTFGALALIALVAASIAPFARRLREPLALGACIAAVAMAFHQIVDCLWIYPKVGVAFWIVIAVGAAAIRQEAAQENSSYSYFRRDYEPVRP